MTAVTHVTPTAKRTRKSNKSIAPAVETVEPVVKQPVVIERTEPVEQEPTEPVIEETKVEAPETVVVELTSARTTKLYVVGEFGGRTRWWDLRKVADFSIDTESKVAIVTLSAKQAKAWRAA